MQRGAFQKGPAMQKLLIGILTLSTTALAIVCFRQSRELRSVRAEAHAVGQFRQAEVEMLQSKDARVKELERTQVRLEKEIEKFSAVTAALRSNETRQATTVAALSQRVATARKSAGDGTAEEKGSGVFGKGMGQMLTSMMKDPGMREMMRDQQSAAVKMMYSGLFKELNLTDDEKSKFTAVLTDMQMKTIENSQLFGEKTDAAEKAKSITNLKTETDNQIKELLGEARFKDYQEYQKNIGERMQVDQVKASMQAQNIPLSDQQSGQILQIMKEEKTAAPPVIPTDANASPDDMQRLMTSENVEKQLAWMEDYNARVLARARQVLTPQQFKEYEAFTERQAAMQKFGMKMAREMFGGEKKPEPAK